MNEQDSVRQAPSVFEPRKNRKRKVFVWTLVTICLLGIFIVGSVSIYVGWQLSHPDRKAVDDHPEQYDLKAEDVEIFSRLDGVRLAGWRLTSAKEDARGVMVLAHGYRGNRLEEGLPALALAQDLVHAGYHVFMFDFRNSGESGGDLTTVGFHEKEDLISVVHEANERFPDLPVGVIGFSMGGSTAIVAAAEEPKIQAVIADSPFADLREYLGDNLSFWSGLPDFPFTPVILTLIPWITGIELDQVSPRESIQDLQVPVLLIHGNGDTAIPYENSEKIWEMGDEERVQLWITDGPDHVGSYSTDPQTYTDKITGFLREAFQEN